MSRPSSVGRASEFRVMSWRPHEDSNLGTRLRRAVLYPLSYGG